MTFTGKQLNELGCPPDIIKFFVNKEFKDEAEVTEAFKNFRKTPPKSDEQKEIERILREDPDCAFNVLMELGHFPGSCPNPSKRQLRQWLEQGAIRVNGKFPEPQNHVNSPITDLVFFPGAKSQTTMQGDDYYFLYPASRTKGQYTCDWTPEEFSSLVEHTTLLQRNK